MAIVAAKSLLRPGVQITSSILHSNYCKSSSPTRVKPKIFNNLRLSALK
jgi:hypothetical protein